MMSGEPSPQDPFASPEDISRPTSFRESQISRRNPFRSPTASSIHSVAAISAPPSVPPTWPVRRFQSSRLIGEFEKPWLGKRKRAPDWDRIAFYTSALIGIAIGGFLCYNSVRQVPKHEYCLIMDDDFSTLDTSIWSYEIQLNGFGTGSFDWTTNDSSNVYVSSDGLHIVPTLTTESTSITPNQLMNGYTVNLTADGTCTGVDQRESSGSGSSCVAVSNATLGTIINPVRSARLTTAGQKTITYGRVEVVAKLPAGDWLWPAIWMMPQDSVYGVWPKSGEIDICESRGNDAETYPLGNNLISSAMHWGTSYLNDMYKISEGEWFAQRTKYSDGFHTFGLEWSKDYLFTWIDGRLRQVLFFNFEANVNMWTLSGLANTAINGSPPADPWPNGDQNAPFDQAFYLILNVAVGGTNGYFPNAVGDKPWVDNSATAMRDFWEANSTWLPTWGQGVDRGMTVKSVKMWQEGACS